MNGRILYALLVLVLLGSILSHAQELVVDASNISLSGFPNEYASNYTLISNSLSQNVTVFVANAEGDLKDNVALDNTNIEVGSNQNNTLSIRVYIFDGVKPGVYYGNITLTTGNIKKSVPTVLTVRNPLEDLDLTLKATPFSESIIPGEAINVQVDVENLAGRETDLLLLTQFIDPTTKSILFEVERNFTIATVKSIVEVLNPPKSVRNGVYSVKTSVYSLQDREHLSELVSDSFEIKVGVSTLTSANLIVKKIFTPSNVQVFFGVLPALMFLILLYWRYRVVEERKRRYLSMVSFDYLPQPGKRSGYVGRLAESTKEAFVELDVMQTHTMCAGATGSGKTVAAQVIVEEALLKNVAVVVFDPTGQWSGFLKSCQSQRMLKLYSSFKMRRSDARSFYGNIRTIESEDEHLDIRKYMNPGQISIFPLHKLSPQQTDTFVANTVKDIFNAQLPESSECSLIIVYDEVHRLLPKFGGGGSALIQIERAVREFRKWGIGILLVSQVLSDFVGEIKANIGTEIQMRTRYESDLERIRLKYGLDIMHSIVKTNVGTGMIQNAEYNQGRPYFVSFRPLLHDPSRLPDDVLGLFSKYNKKLDELSARMESLSNAGVDVFDLNIEINLALENIRKTSFDVVKLYVQSIEERINKLERKLATKTLSEEEKALVSEWEEKGTKELEGYRKLVEGEAAGRRDVLVSLENEVKVAMEGEIKKLETRREEIKKKLGGKITPDEKKKLLEEHKAVVEKEKELEEQLLDDLEGLVGEITRSEGMLWRITADRRMIETQSGELSKKDDELRRRIKMDVASIVDDTIKKKRELVSEEERANLIVKATNIFKKYLVKKAWEEKQLERKKKEDTIVRELFERKGRIYERGRKNRLEFVEKKDRLLGELKEAKGKWSKILENEKKIQEKESQLIEKRNSLRKLITSERDHIASEQRRISEEREIILECLTSKALVPGVSVSAREELLKEIESREKTIDQDFKSLEEEWGKMDKWLEEARRLDEELRTLRTQWETQEGMRVQEEEGMISKKDELVSLRKDVKDMLKDEGEGGVDG